MRFLRRSLTGLFLLAVTIAILAVAAQQMISAIKTRQARENIPPVPHERVFAVNVVPIVVQDYTPVLTAFGELRSERVLDLRSAAGGTVVELSPDFVEGGKVEAGQLLLRVDPTDFETALENARTDLAEAEAEQTDAETALALAREDVASAQKQADLRNDALSRQRNLVARGVGTDAAVENAALAAVASEQAVLARKQALANARARVAQAANKLARRKLALAQAERRLADTKVFAEFSGTLSNVAVVQGGLLTPNALIARIIDPAALEVSFRVSTAQYARLLDQNGRLIQAPVTVKLDVAGLALAVDGRIDRESASVGEGLTGRLLFAKLDQATGLRPGDFVSVEITEPVLHDVVVLPATALDAAGRVLVLGDDDRLEDARVELLRRQGDNIVVHAPDLTGREVVAERSPILGAGIRVRPTRTDDQTTGDQSDAAAGPDMIPLDTARRAALTAFVKGSAGMPEDTRARILKSLEAPQVPARLIDRLERRMQGG
ncbi:MAG TPA: HlyD family efflux transporter periplasmic adaptor subunit [Aliiroseovarius sp.]|nr:HlyD family efflux transporter periplasmic adaptor subunit [Aliiroseovarius sp.]